MEAVDSKVRKVFKGSTVLRVRWGFKEPRVNLGLLDRKERQEAHREFKEVRVPLESMDLRRLPKLAPSRATPPSRVQRASC